jgi:DNA-binding transcriptional MerR regulator
MEKSPEAFRTISEVADLLETPAHVLRFWESRFPQVRPVKRAGGRRYYRPSDVALLSGIKRLLHDDGMTIRGVQKILREHGVRHVAGLSAMDMPEPAEDVEAALAAAFGPEAEDDPVPLQASAGQTAQIISLERAIARTEPSTAGRVVPQPVTAQSVPDVSGDADLSEPVAEAPFVDVQDTDVVDVVSFTTGNPHKAEPVPGSGADTAEEPGGMPGDDDASATLAASLRRLRHGTLDHRKAELTALRNRMIDLRQRLAAASRRRVR